MNRTSPLPRAAKVESYRLRVDARLTNEPGGSLVLEQSRYRLRLPHPEAGRRAVLLRMAEGWLSDLQMAQLVTGLEGEARILPAQLLVRRLLSHSWLERRVAAGARPLLDVVPRGIGAQSAPARRPHGVGVVYRLSRFAVLRTDQGRMLAHSPLSSVAIGCAHTQLGAVLAGAAADGVSRLDVAKGLEVDESTAGHVLDELLTAQVLVTSEEAEAEHGTAPMGLWSPEELWLHDRTRPQRHAAPIGATHRFRGVLEPEPAQPGGPTTRPVIELPAPPPGPVDATRDSLAAVMSRRRSVRHQDDARPITAAQLAEFLHRVQRFEPAAAGATAGATARATDGGVDGPEAGRRPYPGAGGIGELEIYPLVSRCAGLESGLYHYDSVRHGLAAVAATGPETAKMLSFARATASMPDAPQVLFVITARIGRLMWKYEGIPYALALKDAGILTAWMYLVATDMGLAPCALGAGDVASFAALSGLDTLVEPAIAEFALGSCPSDSEEQP
ncbi:SagB family peptide dehydrogenase [Streptomyces sp. NBC_00249]|uniref:SagB family peptide dehydrogenase n=1 Tax=Streptomyces sp. NBC_00249 TaxID=2975690 RepID=UPI002255FD6F|nr:SagB family peptide dehydrogenase [Streptomyces sp. NBC_00249]MCX5195363.1 SagB family peptide dehydrogenase [Streptomyces sp. NBC_00249]